jgi:hypothetical protein
MFEFAGVAQDSHLVEVSGPVLERIELAREMQPSDESPHRCAADDVRLDARSGQGAHDANMRPAASPAAAEGETDGGSAHAIR